MWALTVVQRCVGLSNDCPFDRRRTHPFHAVNAALCIQRVVRAVAAPSPESRDPLLTHTSPGHSWRTDSGRSPPMGKLLVHITSGPEAPTRAALGLLVARAGIDEGHDVTIFLAGDAVQLIRDAVLDSLSGLGTGSLRESFDAIAGGGGRFYVSGMSSKARGVTEDELIGKPAEFAMPNRLVQLAFEADRNFTY